MDQENLFKKLLSRKNLTEEESYQAFSAIMENRLSPIQTGAFLALLRAKGESPSEIIGAVKLLREKAIKVSVDKPVLADTCGTGGDSLHTFNISTAVALLASACGVPIAKHGNRAVSSQCGSADVLETLGYKIDLPPQKTKEILEKFNFAFFFAPLYHQAMKNVASIRKTLGFRTIFNIIGPLTNPANVKVQIAGVSDSRLLKVIPIVFQSLGITGYVFCGADGMDEISLTGKTFMVEVTRNTIIEMELAPENFGFRMCEIKKLKGGNCQENAEMVRKILSGQEKGPRREIVLLNTAVLLKASGKVPSFSEGLILAEEILNSGAAWEKLKKIVEFSNETKSDYRGEEKNTGRN